MSNAYPVIRTILAALALSIPLVMPTGAGAGSAPAGTNNPKALVRALGSSRFTERERAMAQLIQHGIDSLDALERGVQSNDREIRFRCQRILRIVKADEFQRRLRMFAAGGATADRVQLPGWDLFAKQVGSDDVARRLFVEMQKSEHELLRVLDNSPSRSYEALAQRATEIQNNMRLNTSGSRVDVEIGTVAAILFVANNQSRNYPLQTSQYISACFQFPTFRSALEGGEERDLLRAMLGKWIANSEGWSAYQGMMLAMQHDIPQGLDAAKKILQDAANQPNQPYFRYYALSAVGKFGGPAEVPLVEPFLKDKTPYATAVPINGKTKYRTQIRDIALAVLVHLSSQDPKQFGFDRIRKNSLYLFDPNSLAFADDESRETAILQWSEFRNKHQPPKLIAKSQGVGSTPTAADSPNDEQ